MNDRERMKHLDRAFTEMPPELAASVEEAFRRGEKAVKQRHKIMTAVSVAAVLAVLFAAIALAAGMLAQPRIDSVVAAPRGGGEGSGGRAALPRLTPVPEEMEEAAMPTYTPVLEEMEEAVAGNESGEPDAYDDATVYYATQEGVYFHGDEHCGGMRNAWPLNLDAAWVSCKEPCPLCVDGAMLPRMWLYCTEKGEYYHIVPDCSGMKDAQKVSPSVVRNSGKKPCPVCIPDGIELCWATPMGQYYHSDRTCMGMQDARIYSTLYAGKKGKAPCPVCWDGE